MKNNGSYFLILLEYYKAHTLHVLFIFLRYILFNKL